MKKVILVFALLVALVAVQKVNAQVRVGLNVNIGSQPACGPTGYDYVDYYYLPDIDAYYYVPRHQYIYFDDGRWNFSRTLPMRFRDFDFYHAHKVVINEPTPYLHHQQIRERYVEFKGRREEQHIYNNSDERYRNYYRGNHRNQPPPPQEHRDEHHDNDHHDNGHRDNDHHD